MIAFAETPRRGQHQTHGAVGGGVGQHSGRVGDDDAPLGGRGHVDVVEAHRVVADGAQPGQSRVHHGTVDAVAQLRAEHVNAVGQPLLQCGGGQDLPHHRELSAGGNQRRIGRRQRQRAQDSSCHDCAS